VKGGTRAEVLVLSGTGSCCYGRTGEGRVAKVGGRGHVIGDRGSACDIGLRALRAVMADLDHHGGMGPLGAGILNALVFNEPDDLIPWSAQASKTEIAALAVTVFAFAARGDGAGPAPAGGCGGDAGGGCLRVRGKTRPTGGKGALHF